MINYKKTYKESTSWRHWRLSCSSFFPQKVCSCLPNLADLLGALRVYVYTREIHPLDPQPHRHSILVPRVCAPLVTQCSLGKYWSRDWFRGNFSLTQGLWNQQAANPRVHMLSLTHSGVRQRNLMTHAQCHSLSTTPRYKHTFCLNSTKCWFCP